MLHGSSMYTHILQMDYVREGRNHLIVPFKFAFNSIGNSLDIIIMGIPMCTGSQILCTCRSTLTAKQCSSCSVKRIGRRYATVQHQRYLFVFHRSYRRCGDRSPRLPLAEGELSVSRFVRSQYSRKGSSKGVSMSPYCPG